MSVPSSGPAPVGLTGTDFLAAQRRNRRQTRWLLLILTLIAGGLGAIIGAIAGAAAGTLAGGDDRRNAIIGAGIGATIDVLVVAVVVVVLAQQRVAERDHGGQQVVQPVAGGQREPR